jgi:hypothetical protein
MRIRTIKPDFYKHEGIASLAPLTRILFIGLWGLADCEGRLKDRYNRIKLDVLPYDDYDADAGLSELARAGFIVRYKAGGDSLIQVVNFTKHQSLAGKEAKAESAFPAPSKGDVEASGKVPGNVKAASDRRGSDGEAPGKGQGSDGEATGKHSGSSGEVTGKKTREQPENGKNAEPVMNKWEAGESTGAGSSGEVTGKCPGSDGEAPGNAGKGKEREKEKEKEKEGVRGRAAAPPVFVFPKNLDTPTFRTAWDDWLAYRRERRLPALKPRSVEAQLAKLAEWGWAAAVSAIRNSIRNGWQGLFEPKSPPGGAGPGGGKGGGAGGAGGADDVDRYDPVEEQRRRDAFDAASSACAKGMWSK